MPKPPMPDEGRRYRQVTRDLDMLLDCPLCDGTGICEGVLGSDDPNDTGVSDDVLPCGCVCGLRLKCAIEKWPVDFYVAQEAALRIGLKARQKSQRVDGIDGTIGATQP